MTSAPSLPDALPPSDAPAPAADRADAILAQIREVFVEKGFDGASMQDLARAAGMSVGNFYRYFPSKAAIVEAMVGRDMAEIEAKFADIRTADDLMGAVRAKVAGEVCAVQTDKGGLWAEINAAARRKSEIATICAGMEELVARNMLGVFARVTGLAPAECQQRFGAHARFVVLMVKTVAMRNSTIPDPDLTALVLESINRVLDEVTAAASDKT